MNILYLITDLGLGGAEVMLVDLANQMSRKGHRVSILALGSENKHSINIDRNINVQNLSMSKNLFGFIRVLFRVRSYLILNKIEVLHAHMIHANLIARIVKAIFPNVYVISTAHSNNEGGRLRMLLYRFTDFLSDLNTNVSDGALQRYIQIKAFSKRKSAVVYNSIDTERFVADSNLKSEFRNLLGLNKDHFLFLNVGRLTEVKNQALILKAFANVVPQFPHARLALVGCGELEFGLKELCSQLDLNESVTFLGEDRRIEGWCNASDAFVLASRFEGFGIVLAEAMACECPVISTRVGGCPEVVGNCGKLFESESLGGLEAAMKHMLVMSDEDRSKMGFYSRQRVLELFDLKKSIQIWEDFYKRASDVK